MKKLLFSVATCAIFAGSTASLSLAGSLGDDDISYYSRGHGGAPGFGWEIIYQAPRNETSGFGHGETSLANQVPSVEENFQMPELGSSSQMETVVSPAPGIGEQLGRELGPVALGMATGALTAVAGAGMRTSIAVGGATALSPVSDAARDAGAAVGAYTDKTGNNALLPNIESGHSPHPGKSVADSMVEGLSKAFEEEQIDLGPVDVEKVLEPSVTSETVKDAQESANRPQMRALRGEVSHSSGSVGGYSGHGAGIPSIPAQRPMGVPTGHIDFGANGTIDATSVLRIGGGGGSFNGPYEDLQFMPQRR
ncbi:hypothetical protein [Ruegeria sp. HKCCA5929]|uniref:hypothetical protein n=1 Tax=Ruegeria sp. HKCCA5929 TaxID=2682988 RepID=UPI001487FEA0|nr:hypothetical protein [Ruegeria sp. HKCCA5929]